MDAEVVRRVHRSVLTLSSGSQSPRVAKSHHPMMRSASRLCIFVTLIK